MKHFMRLQHAPFLSIKSGRKRIEMRLYDEKRASINVGDCIEFLDMETEETILCEVVHLYRYANFNQLYAHHDKISLGYAENEDSNPEDMLVYYSQEEVAKYGVVGIEIMLQ